ncbi:MAG TPA: hypothetical protein VHX86_15240 [Tepidisphaeraceae bacterium]|jgi:hypothetical protein|nr:hypothetical protein [Tepidisphaeraceae bacterium]
MAVTNAGRRTIGYVMGSAGFFARSPFYEIRLDKKKAVPELDRLLAKGNAKQRCTVTLTASFHQPDRLRVTEIDPPDYESRASAAYLRGDVMRVQGREGISCGLDLSARLGVQALRNELRLASERAKAFVVLRVPSRKRDIIELIPDVDLDLTEKDVIVAGSVAAATAMLPPEDFSDWKA